MSARIESYGFISNMHGAGLVSRDGSLDWLCVPRFDSDACMCALLGREEHGYWQIHPGVAIRRTARRYRPGTMILETDWECDGGAVRMTDFMAGEKGRSSVVRLVEGLAGSVPMTMSLVARFGHGQYSPWLRHDGDGILLTTAPDSLRLRTAAPLTTDAHDIGSRFVVDAGRRTAFELTWQSAHLPAPPPLDTSVALEDTERRWVEWSARSTYHGRYKEAVDRSLLTLKALTYAPTGGIVAAPTTSLPETLGGIRNWDYRYCWLRDATLTLYAFTLGGYIEEAEAWRTWFLNAIAGRPDEIQIMYGIDGTRRLTEFDAPWLPGYEDSRPVRIGNAASEQFQLDVPGEVIRALFQAQRLGLPERRAAITLLLQLAQYLQSAWERPDDGIWEMRGGPQHFVHSKMMAWLGFERLARLFEGYTQDDDRARAAVPTLHALARRVHDDVCERGFDRQQQTFTQAYGNGSVDAGLLLMPALGFLPASDPRVQGTIRAIEKRLLRDGFVLRYDTNEAKDGLTDREGAFLACSFWLVDAYAYAGRLEDAESLFERLLALRNDLGLLSEEYDAPTGRLIGNFPQAFSHLALIHSATVLSKMEGLTR
jgi:GH15 family glucan-1,4-alpha-glucosidase